MSLLKKIAVAVPVVAIGYSKLAIDRDMELPPALPVMSQTFSTTQADTVAYYADTSGEGTPLVLVHSVNAAASAREMQPLFEQYRGQRPVYALDLPGYGHSDRSERMYTPQLFADVIKQFMQSVVGDSADVIALSLGCEFVARAAIDAPELFRTLTFISPTGFTRNGSEGNSEQNDKTDRAYNLVSFPLWSQALYDLLVSRPSIRYFLRMSFATVQPPQPLTRYAYLTAHQPGAKNVPLYFLSGKLFTRDIAQTIYPRLTMSTHVLFDQDPYVNFDQLLLFVAEHSQWNVSRIHGTKGLPHWEKPVETFEAIGRFFQEQHPTQE